jgi:serine/threonine-protein kinase
MGDVWRAEHKMLARPAAVKLIGSQTFATVDAGRALRRFEREARATAFLESQHTIDVYDFGLTDEGSFYYAMELLNGIDLESLVRDFGPVPPERVVHILSGVCESLAEAHAHEFIHRDIKPTNIYLCRKGLDHDFVKVLDFGLVKAAVDPEGDGAGLTAAGNILGTPSYIAPEMALGTRKIDCRADLYALGCVAFWLCTGTLVFEAESPVGVLLHHVQTPPPRIHERCEVEVPAQLKEIVQDCLAKDPDDRPQSATELAARLAAIAFDDPWTPERAERWWHLHLPDRTLEAGVRQGGYARPRSGLKSSGVSDRETDSAASRRPTVMIARDG